jgi:acyl carrier protein
MNIAILEKIRPIVATVLELPEDQVVADSSPQHCESWDSVRHLNLILALEQEFAIQFEPDEIDQMHNLCRIAAIVEHKTQGHA